MKTLVTSKTSSSTHQHTMTEVATCANIAKPAVQVVDAYKSYSSNKKILKGLNLTVPRKAIYALLGPSGCGKTTLLNCITGLTELDSGTIELSITEVQQLGYMPQSLSLYGRLTIKENFYFHGYLYGMSNKSIQQRAKELMSFLELPSENSMIRQLSGGQQRRVSLATVFLHQPVFLILDEPTVGLDPILSHTIWERLRGMTKLGLTVVITTHYVQEAHRADIVGFMRDGVLVVEKNPQELLLQLNYDTLDEAFLHLSENQECETVKITIKNLKTKEESAIKKPFRVIFQKNKSYSSLTKIKGMLYKTTCTLKRDYLLILVAFIVPFANSYFFNWSIGRNPKGLHIAVVNDEVPSLGCQSINYSCFLDSDHVPRLSCLFIKLMEEKSYKFIPYKDESVALAEVRKNKAWALLHFTSNFSIALSHKLQDGRNVDPVYLTNSSIDTWVDSSNRYIGSFVMYDLVQAMTKFLAEIFLNCGENKKLGSLPIVFEEPIFGKYDVNFIFYASGAMMILYCFTTPCYYASVEIHEQRMDGILTRTLVTGTTIFDITVSVFIFQMIVFILQSCVIIYVMYFVFDNPIYGNAVLFVILLILCGSAGIFLGITMGLIIDNSILLGGAVTGINMMISLTTGFVWPIEGMHKSLKLLRWFFPLIWVVDATRGICVKSYAFYHPVIVKGFAALLLLNLLLAASVVIVPKLIDRIMAKMK